MSREEAMRAVLSLRMSPELLTVVAAALSSSRAMAPQALPIDFIAAVSCVMIGVEDLAPGDVAANLRTIADRLEGASASPGGDGCARCGRPTIGGFTRVGDGCTGCTVAEGFGAS